ncbi:hypothetical protein IKQ21_05470 [bacterium]|nr:hypothetical protein [bacterium]
MEDLNNRKFVGRLIFSVLTSRRSVREAIALFPDSMDKNIECAYHALVHYEADEDMRYQDIEYREEQDDYLEFIAQNLVEGKELPRNIIADYEDYYKGVAKPWVAGIKGFLKEFARFINT